MRQFTVDKCIQVQNLMNSGISQVRACTELKISAQTFRNWLQAGAPSMGTHVGPGPNLNRPQYLRITRRGASAEALVQKIKDLEARREEMVRDVDRQIDATRARLGQLLSDAYLSEKFEVTPQPGASVVEAQIGNDEGENVNDAGVDTLKEVI